MRVLGISIFIIVFDQLTKILVKSSFALEESSEIISGFLYFTYIENPGMAFGIRFAGPWFFTLFSFLASGIILYYLYKLRRERLSIRTPLALVLGGAVGNLIDRFLYGRVVDFIEIVTGNYNWPVFNIADVAVTVGMVILISLIVFDKDEQQKDDSQVKMTGQNPADSEERDIWQAN